MTAKPASHSKNSFTDKQSISLIENILSKHGRVMPNLSSIDKWPNIDGRVEMQDEQGRLVGPLTVQVKTLPDNHNLKFSCPVSFLSYCEIEPCLLLGVDNSNEKVYWKYFDSTITKTIDFKNNQHKTLYFDAKHYFDKNEKSYLDAWTAIIENNRRRQNGYDELSEAYEKLRQNANELIGAEDESFRNIHLFLDELNKNYDSNFPTAKKFFYSNVWKLGIAYERYESSSVMYTIFPIKWDKNDIQIKRIDKVFVQQAHKTRLGFTGHFHENPIETRPVEYAREVAGSDAQKLVQRKLLSIYGNAVLANEIVFAFMDRFYEQMGFSKPLDEYELKFIFHGFNNYLPVWMNEAYKILRKPGRSNINDQIQRKGYYDPDILWQIKPEERALIKQNVSNNLNSTSVSFTIANSEYDMGVFLEALRYLQDTNTPIKRVYRLPDYSRLDDRPSLVWNQYSISDSKHNIEIVLKNLEEVYNTMIDNNFPGLRDELGLVKEFEELGVYYKFQDIYTNNSFGPTYNTYRLKYHDDTKRSAIRIIGMSEAERYEKKVKDRSNNKSDSPYVRIVSHSTLRFLYSKMPLMTLIYDILEDRLKDYLGK